MEIKEIQIGRIKNNEENPRIISEENFQKLVKQIVEMPSMNKLREILVDEDMVALGGNQRLKAYREAGWKKIQIKKVSPEDFAFELSQEGATWEKVKKRIIVADNKEFGEWAKSLIIDFGFEETMDEVGIGREEWDEEEISFEPNYNPSASNHKMTQEQMDKKEEVLKAQMTMEHTTKKVVCPHCFEEFEIDK